MKSLTKKQLCNLLGISAGTLQNYLNNIWYDKLKEVGYNKRQKVLSVRMINLIKEFWGDFEE